MNLSRIAIVASWLNIPLLKTREGTHIFVGEMSLLQMIYGDQGNA